MEHSPQDILLISKLSRRIADAWKSCKTPFLASLIFALLAYPFAFTNKLVNHDEVSQLFLKGATVTSGRWGLGLLDAVLPNYSMPWIYGVITVVLVALSVCIIVRVFAIRTSVFQVLLAGSIMVFPSLIGLFGYMFTSSGYAVAFFCAVAAVGCIRRSHERCHCEERSDVAISPLRQGLPNAVAALGLLGFSLSIYQGYLSVAAGLLVVALIRDLLLGDSFQAALKRGIFYVAFLLTALAGYYIATQVLLRLLDIGFNEYASGAVTFRLGDIPKGIAAAYQYFGEFFTWNKHALVPTPFSRTVHYMLFAACAVLLLCWLRRQGKQDVLRVALLAVLLGVLPLAINCMYMITAAESIHTLVLYGFVCLYVLAAVILETQLGRELLRRGALDLAAISLALIIAINTYVANEAYLNLHLRYENAYAFFTTLVSDLKQMPQFQEGTKLAVVGSYDSPDFYDAQFPFLAQLQGTTGFLPESYSYGYFLEYYIGVPLPIADAEEIEAITATKEYQDMAVYPYYGSTKVIHDIIVVKLS